ncbi:hypothetical protein SAMN05428642_10517 [Flaviramulus basaltis]|uniref:Uncharacterized protein n=1 Tax=Flaviramulus basaltis TaxID=369401 RepID=A0A1K2IQL5_9FLAO|nr:hypothetical protein [Flaviramulus basaltis]SFZ94721.1 hypothetical protein SAMN05428642_10517 [Flaviramulus basaltis]|tara:strand:+ start:1095 stop:1220 length:126 start_codon:yes stop_codon:yes gene_type:complete
MANNATPTSANTASHMVAKPPIAIPNTGALLVPFKDKYVGF